MERESRASDSDRTMRSILNPLRSQREENAPVPDVDEQFRNLVLTPPKPVLVLIPEGDKTSKESHLENYMRLIEHGWSPKDARGQSGDKNYGALAELRKRDSNLYDKDPENRFKRIDRKGHLREAWRHLKENWEVLDPKSHEFYLREFMDIINNPKTPREEKLSELYNKIVREKEQSPHPPPHAPHVIEESICFVKPVTNSPSKKSVDVILVHTNKPWRGKADGREREELAEFGDYEEELTESGDYEEELAGLYGKIIRERGKIIRERANAQGWIFY